MLGQNSAFKALRKQKTDKFWKVFNRLDTDGTGHITAKNIDTIFAYLKHVPLTNTIYGISEAEYMIWESDDSLTGYLDFETFVTKIAICDSSSRRSCPRRLYDLFVFLALDKDGDGTVDTDELMELILKKYGRTRLDELFGSLETGANQAGCTLSYTEFTGNVALNLASLNSRGTTSAFDEQNFCSFFVTVKAFLMGPQGKGSEMRWIPKNGLNIDFKEKLAITSIFSQIHSSKTN
jgi:Ca2+-binding EF-hand superfamily protein